jgi:ABC-type transport system involved in multi-copper enzyme maturation permease subunit
MIGALGRIYAVALNTFRWAIRHRFLIAVVLVSLGVMLFALVLGEMSLHQEERVAVDVALGGTSFFGCITAIVLGVLLLYTEVQRRTIHTMLAKPIERHELLLGRYLGMAATLTLLVLVSTGFILLLFELQGVGFGATIVKALLLIWAEILVIAAVAAFFSSFSSPILSGVFTFGIFLVGRATPELRAAIRTATSPAVRGLCRAALYAVPDLDLFQVSGTTLDGKPVSVHATFVDWPYVAQAAAHGALYVLMLLLASTVIFARRDFL